MTSEKRTQLLNWCRRMDDILQAAIEGNEPPGAGEQMHKLLGNVETGLHDEVKQDQPK